MQRLRVLAACFWLAWSANALAQVRFDVFIGYDGIVTEGRWFPVVCEVQNNGPSIRAVVEIDPGSLGASQTRQVPLELPTGTTKRFVIPVFNGGRYNWNWAARLLDEKGHVLAETPGQQIRKQTEARIPLTAALARSGAGAPLLPDIKIDNKIQEWQPGVARLPTAVFPDNPIALDGLNTIYLNSEKALDLKQPQVTALLAWLHGGGHLVVAVEHVGQVNGNEWLRALLPGELAGVAVRPVQGMLQQWLANDERFDGTTNVFRKSSASPSFPFSHRNRDKSSEAPAPPSGNANPNPWATLAPDPEFEQGSLSAAGFNLREGKVSIGSPAAPLAVQVRRGRGQLTVLLFSPELEPFLSWKNRAYFWAKLADFPPELLSPGPYQGYGGRSIDGLFGSLVDSTQARKLPIAWLLLLLCAYLAVIGPVDYFVLKKLNRQMLTWITFPVYVVFFSGLIYFIGYRLRAGETEWNELNIVDIMPVGDQADWRGRTYASVYSPVNARYRLESEQPYAALRGEFMASYGNSQESGRATIRQRGNNFDAEITVPVWTSQMFVSDWWRRADPPLRMTVTSRSDGWTVTVENRLDRKLNRVQVVVGEAVEDLTEMNAHERRSVQIHAVPGTNSVLVSFVAEHAARFASMIDQRQRAFGEDKTQLGNKALGVMAACFVSRYRPGESSQNLITPPGFDLARLLERGDAVVLAWVDDYSPVKPLNRFSPRRQRHETLLRLAVPGRPEQ